MRRNLELLLISMVLLVGCGQTTKEQIDIKTDVNKNQSLELLNEVYLSFDKLCQYNGIISINDLNSAISHSDVSDIVEGVFEQDEWLIKINPLKQEGEFSNKTSMYSIIDKKISMLGEGSDIDLTYDNLLKNYIRDTKPYKFTLANDKVVKMKGTPSFYCEENCPGAYYGKTRNDTNNYIVDSFSKEDADKISLEVGSGQGSNVIFDWVRNYKNRINLFLDIQSENIELSHVSIEKNNNEKTNSIVLKRDLKSISNEKKDEMLAYLTHGTSGVWEITDAYVTVEIDKDGYPLKYEEIIKAKHIQTNIEVPLYRKVLIER